MGSHQLIAVERPVVIAATPGDIAGLQGWFKGSEFDSTTDGTEVTTWTDQGPATRNVTAAGLASNRPTVARNAINTSMTAVHCNDKVGLQSPTTYPGGTAITLLIVFKFPSNPVTARTDFFSTNGGTWLLGINTNGRLHIHHDSVGEYEINAAVSANVWHYLTLTASGSVVTNAFIDAAAVTWANVGFGTTPTFQSSNYLRVVYGQSNWIGWVAEAAIYDVALSTPDRQALEAYAASRFGL